MTVTNESLVLQPFSIHIILYILVPMNTVLEGVAFFPAVYTVYIYIYVYSVQKKDRQRLVVQDDKLISSQEGTPVRNLTVWAP